jgi:hypothetical protein
MSAEKPVSVNDKGEDYEIHVDVANDCTIRVVCLDSSGAVSYIPTLTPFEAGMLATAIERASNRADAR